MKATPAEHLQCSVRHLEGCSRTVCLCDRGRLERVVLILVERGRRVTTRSTMSSRPSRACRRADVVSPGSFRSCARTDAAARRTRRPGQVPPPQPRQPRRMLGPRPLRPDSRRAPRRPAPRWVRRHRIGRSWDASSDRASVRPRSQVLRHFAAQVPTRQRPARQEVQRSQRTKPRPSRH